MRVLVDGVEVVGEFQPGTATYSWDVDVVGSVVEIQARDTTTSSGGSTMTVNNFKLEADAVYDSTLFNLRHREFFHGIEMTGGTK